MDININKQLWNTFTNDEMAIFKTAIFNHYRTNGFPYFDTDKNKRDLDFNSFINYDKPILIDNVLKQTMHGLSLCWSYFPHAFDVKCNDKLTPLEVFNDDVLFKKVIDKRIKMGDNISDNGIRKMMKIFTNTQAVSNFRPTAAFALYKEFGNNGVVYDMSCGWGGRLLGAEKAKVTKYIGCEPSTLTFNGLQNMIDDFISIDTEIHQLGSEIFIPNEPVDFCFTSPPYFDREKYSNEDTQSYIKFKTLSDWLVGFLLKTMENCFKCLKNGSYMGINIANIDKNDIVNETIKLAESVGFKYEYELKLALSNMGKFSGDTKQFKYEPVLMFKKII